MSGIPFFIFASWEPLIEEFKLKGSEEDETDLYVIIPSHIERS